MDREHEIHLDCDGQEIEKPQRNVAFLVYAGILPRMTHFPVFVDEIRYCVSFGCFSGIIICLWICDAGYNLKRNVCFYLVVSTI